MKVFSFNHRDHALDVIERLSPLAQDDLEVTLRQIPGVRGAVVLATCNRIEILVECDPDAAPSRDAETAIADLLAAPLVGTPLAGERARTYEGEAVIDHLCTLACGLESMVVGEREITGQLRHALRRAERNHTTSGATTSAINWALQTARIVERETGLSGMGRSVASVALDHAASLLPAWSDVTVTMFGTGSYAGATVTNLIDRGCRKIYVHSRTGRAKSFAHGRGLTAVTSDEQLQGALARTDLIVSCRGLGSPTVTTEHVATHVRDGHHRFVVLDLAVVRDVDPQIAQFDGITLIDLETVRSLVPDLAPERTERARQIVSEEVRGYLWKENERQLGPTIHALDNYMRTLVDEQMRRLPERPLRPDDVEKALNRMARKILHQHTTAAHTASAHGQAGQFMQAVRMLTGVSSETPEASRAQVRKPVGSTETPTETESASNQILDAVKESA